MNNMNKERENEHRTVSIRPAKSVSLAGVIMLIFMFLFGVGFAILIGQTLYENEAPIGLYFVFSVFIIGWLGTVLFLLVYNIQNLRRAKGVSLIDIDVSENQ